MGVFISWSGKDSKSHKVAILLRGWIGNVIQHVRPFVSDVDIEAGSHWASQMFQALKENQVGIICVTRKNQSEPWINFEAGALAKAMESSRVCPLLIDLRPADVTGPLTTLQMQSLDKEGLFNVLQVVNQNCISEPLTKEDLRKQFDKWWSEFDDGLAEIMSAHQPSKPTRDTDDMLEEILNLVRSIDKSTSFTFRRPLAALGLGTYGTLLHEVQASAPALYPILQKAFPGYVDDILVLTFPSDMEKEFGYLNDPPYFQALRDSVRKLGLRVTLMMSGRTRIDFS